MSRGLALLKFRAAVLEEFRRPFVIKEVDLSPSNDEARSASLPRACAAGT